MSTEKAPWEYADPVAANKKLRAIVEDESIRREFQEYLSAVAEFQKESYKRNYEKNYPRYLINARNRRARRNLADGSHTGEEVHQMVRDQGRVCA